MNKLAYLEELNWSEVKEDVEKYNPELANIIDSIKLTTKHTFIKARYPYGKRILFHGDLYLPTAEGQVEPITSDCLPKAIRNKLDYRFVPIGIISSRSVEVYFETMNRVMPSKLYTEGDIFGLWQLFDPEPDGATKRLWHLSSGARSIFMLPKISDRASHDRLRRDWGISAYPPKSLLDHHQIFSEIAQREESEDPWACEIIFFTKQWADDVLSNKRFIDLYAYWLRQSWRQSLNCRNQMNFNLSQETFAETLSRRNVKPTPYILNTLSHIISIGNGTFPGFLPAVNNEVAAPITLIQQAYEESYLLKHAPIIMYPHHLQPAEQEISVFYSMSFPTVLDFAPKSRKLPYIMSDIRELRFVTEILQEHLNDNKVSFNFYHSEDDRYHEIQSSKLIPEEDSLMRASLNLPNKKRFPYKGPFLSGCVKVSLD